MPANALTSFKAAVNALLAAPAKSTSKADRLKAWFKENFSIEARIAQINEDRQIGMRLTEQFDHHLPIVVFVCSKDINFETLEKRIRAKAYPELQAVLVVSVSSGRNLSYEHLYARTDTPFSDWVERNMNLSHDDFMVQQKDLNYGKTINLTEVQPCDSSEPILAAIRAKPFILLAGMSGTGKTRIVRQLARGCCPTGSDLAKDPDHPGNYECIPVRPNWHDSTGLMGYVSRIDGAKYVITDFVRFLAKAWLYEEEGIPFFLCLDEMNLAPVEQYFAEYLSVIESRRVKDGKIVSDPLVRITDEGLLKAAIDVVYKGVEHETAEKFKAFFVSQGGIPIPSNLVVMGTVNMDETTCSFPHKVLDRAMTFELNEFDINSGLESNPDTPLGSIKVENAKGTFTHGWQVYAEAKDVCDKIKPYLVSVNAVLNGTKFKFAYRTRDEVMAYCVERMKDGTALVAALDEATSMKVLSRVEGDEQIVKRTWLEKLQTAIADGLKALCAEGEEPPKKCADKLAEMHKRLVDTGFTSFWA